VRTVLFNRLARAVRDSFSTTTDLQWPYWIGAHMVKLVQSPERDADGCFVMVTRAV
jgi:hypothetical protein